jgi:hypothetical protein
MVAETAMNSSNASHFEVRDRSRTVPALARAIARGFRPCPTFHIEASAAVGARLFAVGARLFAAAVRHASSLTPALLLDAVPLHRTSPR